ncbi:hypothetical protein NA57DRAFT_59263 [Rhizodiscina lignyota]|uniref:Transmembrane protein n=1 Tax=Rhizodiscina lignyota TaxID=1504668 RepID=A0A9P4M303_9PEZI|nr:hypothetical protein NA57DRAFT_59263 [Rhizodiscina lignyota]
MSSGRVGASVTTNSIPLDCLPHIQQSNSISIAIQSLVTPNSVPLSSVPQEPEQSINSSTTHTTSPSPRLSQSQLQPTPLSGMQESLSLWRRMLKWITFDRNTIIAGLVIGILAAVPAWNAYQIAIWTARKDYLEYCQENIHELVQKLKADCTRALQNGLRPPPYVPMSNSKRNVQELRPRGFPYQACLNAPYRNLSSTFPPEQHLSKQISIPSLTTVFLTAVSKVVVFLLFLSLVSLLLVWLWTRRRRLNTYSREPLSRSIHFGNPNFQAVLPAGISVFGILVAIVGYTTSLEGLASEGDATRDAYLRYCSHIKVHRVLKT